MSKTKDPKLLFHIGDIVTNGYTFFKLRQDVYSSGIRVAVTDLMKGKHTAEYSQYLKKVPREQKNHYKFYMETKMGIMSEAAELAIEEAIKGENTRIKHIIAQKSMHIIF